MLARFALRNDKVILFTVFVLALLGVRAYLSTPQSIFPNMSFSRVDVVADAGDLPPDRVLVAIARPLGQALQTLPGVTDVTATASQGSAEALVSFSGATDPSTALAVVDRAIEQIRANVPDAKQLVAQAVNPNREPVVSYSLTSDALSQTALRQIALAQIARRLYGTRGLGQLLVNGGSTPEYHVTLDAAALQANALGAADVEKAITDAIGIRSVGTAQRHYQTYSILLDGGLADRAALESISVPRKAGDAVSLSALGTISPGVSPAVYQTSLGGRSAVIINAYAASGADTVGMARELATRVRAVIPALPAEVRLASCWDQTTLIAASQSALRDAILIGALLAVLAIYAFLRDVRLMLVAAAIIPLALAIAVFALNLAGQTLNLMSVGGLAVAVGLIIDDAIVVIEGIARRAREEPAAGIAAAIERALRDLAVPMIASTATTVVVFLPLALLTGVTGFFFRALAFTLSASLVVSLALALFVAPVLARSLLRDGATTGREHAGRHVADGFTATYARVLNWSLENRPIVALASVVTLVVTFGLLTHLPSDFLPKMDEGEFEVGYTLPPGTSLAASDAAAREMERIVAADPAVADVAGLTGIDSNGVSPTQPNQGALRVRLVDPSRRAAYEVVADRLRDRLSAATPASIFDFRQILEDLINDLSGTPAPIEISIFGDDPQTLNRLAGTIADKIGRLANVVDAASSVNYNGPSIRIAPLSAQLATSHLTTNDIGDALAALGQGTVVAQLPGSQALVPVRVSVASGPAAALDPFAPLYAGGSATSLRALARTHLHRLDSDIVTENGTLVTRVTANFEGGSLSAVTMEIQRALDAVSLPPGYTTTIGGQAQTQSRSFGEFANVVGLAIVLVFAVMLATFRSFRTPLVILTAVPLALIGVALGLFFTRTAFNVSSFMGLLLLVGVVVKNGILLIYVADRRRAAGDGVRDALIAAGTTRLRPIVMTTLAAIGGLAPLAIGFGQGSEMEKPLAIAVIGGLSTATIFTLVVIPVIYAAFAGRGTKRISSGAIAVTLVLVFLAATSCPASAATESDGPQVFTHLSLDAAATAALAASPDVRAARAVEDEARYALAAARGSAVPSFVTNYTQVPQGNPPGPNVISRQVGAGLQFTLADLLGAAPAAREAAYAFAASQLDERSAETAERTKLAGLYFDALKARAQAAAASDALALAVSERDAARTRFRAGDAARLDVVRSDVEVAKARAALALALAADANWRDALAAETGVDPTLLEGTEAAAVVTQPALRTPQEAVLLARTSRTEIASAARVAEAARAAIATARSANFPAVTFGGGYLTGSDSGVPVNAPTITAGVSIPLGSSGHDRAAAAAAKADEMAAKAAEIERQILLDVAASARSAEALERAASASASARTSAREELTAIEIGYKSGASSSLELITARSMYAQAVLDDIASTYDLEKARVTLDIEIGR